MMSPAVQILSIGLFSILNHKLRKSKWLRYKSILWRYLEENWPKIAETLGSDFRKTQNEELQQIFRCYL